MQQRAVSTVAATAEAVWLIAGLLRLLREYIARRPALW
jgi:hypothetical protein